MKTHLGGHNRDPLFVRDVVFRVDLSEVSVLARFTAVFGGFSFPLASSPIRVQGSIGDLLLGPCGIARLGLIILEAGPFNLSPRISVPRNAIARDSKR